MKKFEFSSTGFPQQRWALSKAYMTPVFFNVNFFCNPIKKNSS